MATAMISYGIFMIYLFVILFKLMCKSKTFIDVIFLIAAIFILSSICIYQGIVFIEQWKTRKEHKWRGNMWHMYVIKTYVQIIILFYFLLLFFSDSNIHE